jgi:hypothetical protein
MELLYFVKWDPVVNAGRKTFHPKVYSIPAGEVKFEQNKAAFTHQTPLRALQAELRRKQATILSLHEQLEEIKRKMDVQNAELNCIVNTIVYMENQNEL